MTRIEHDYDASQIDNLAIEMGIRTGWRRGRCEHGKTPEKVCRCCEGGYMQDTHYFANLPDVAVDTAGGRLCGVSDDGYDVAYIPAPFQTKVTHYLQMMARGLTVDGAIR